MYRLLILFFLIFSSYSILEGQSPYLQKTQYTIDDGLPSNECHDIIQDSLGYIWIATDRGLSRFDGSEFKSYGIKEGLEDISCLQLFLDHNQNIWINTYSKRLFKYIPKIDSIVPYAHNEIFQTNEISLGKMGDFYVDKHNTTYINIIELGLLIIDSNGKYNILNNKKNTYNYFTYEIENKIFYCSTKFKNKTTTTSKEKNSSLEFLHKNRAISIDRNSQAGVSLPKAHKINGDEIVIYNKGIHYYFDSIGYKKSRKGFYINDLTLSKTNEIITAQIYNKGVKIFQDYEDMVKGDFSIVLLNVSATRLLHDKKDNLFVSTIDDGIFYLKRNTINWIKNDGIHNKKINSLECDQNSNLIIVKDKKELLAYNVVTNTLTNIYKSKYLISDILFKKSTNELIVSDINKSFYIKNNNLQPIYQDGHNEGPQRIIGKKAIELSDNTNMIIHPQGFIIYSKLNTYPDFNSYPTLKNLKINSGAIYKDSSYLLGCLDGLYIFHENKLTKQNFLNVIFNTRINDIIHIDTTYIIGTQGYGIAIWDGHKKVQIINKQHGLISNNIERIHLDDEGNLFVCTFSGLSKISFDEDQIYHINNYTKQHGLPSNEVNDVTKIGKTIYIATRKGIATMSQEPIDYFSIAPIIESIVTEDASHKPGLIPTPLNSWEHNITIHYKTLDISMQGDIKYQYALNNEKWHDTQSTSVNFASLKPGNYIFSVRSSNRNGKWSNPLLYKFEIAQPWWRTAWFYLLASFFTLIIGYLLVLVKANQNNAKNIVRNEMNELERSALQAQMNPHFIFNCLNSIQNFIMNNEKESAMDYLSRFAKLIRQNLKASTESKVSLDMEISMLKNYLSLEKMRFNNSFEYQLFIAGDIVINKIVIPPLLIQPFVENAVIHGMKTKYKDGLIQLLFYKTKDQLSVTIKDNGEGYKFHNKKLNKSMGISITQKRLAHINSSLGDNYQVESNSDQYGTEIRILIKYENKSS